jgi:glycosyltransferase involved in cell wall biosynthesis
MQYLLAAWDKQSGSPRVQVIDSRGAGHVAWSALHLLGALFLVAKETALGRCRLLHINLSQRGSTARKLAVVAFARCLRRPYVLHLHGSDYQEFVRGLPRPLRFLVADAFRHARRVLVLGDAWGRFVEQELGVDRRRIVVMPNAVPGPRGSRERSNQRCRLLFLGRLGARKGVPELLEALATPEVASLSWEACLAGDGDIDGYRRRAGSLGLSGRIEFPGWVGEEAARQLLAASDVLVLPSHAENLPLSVLEGMANGLAIVCTAVGALGEVVVEGESALLVPIGDSAALSKALARVIGDEELRRRLGDGARARWADGFDIERYARRMSAVYDRIAPR